jgi:hypothetical protein
MGKIYVNQSELRLQLNTTIDLTQAALIKIKYIKPGSTVVNEVVAGVFDVAKGIIIYDFHNGELDTVGNWTFWADVTFSDGRNAPSEPVKLRIWVEGT